MILEIRETRVYTGEIDPMDVVRAFPVEWLEFLGEDAETGNWGEKEAREFARETAHEIDIDLFLELRIAPECDTEFEVDLR